MSTSHLIAIVNRCSAMLNSMQSKLDDLETKVATSSSIPTIGANTQSVTYASQEILDKANVRLSNVESMVKELSKSLLDARTTFTQSRDDHTKEKAALEASIVFKVEQIINRSVKERMDHIMEDVKSMLDAKLASATLVDNASLSTTLSITTQDMQAYIDKAVASLPSSDTENVKQLIELSVANGLNDVKKYVDDATQRTSEDLMNYLVSKMSEMTHAVQEQTQTQTQAQAHASPLEESVPQVVQEQTQTQTHASPLEESVPPVVSSEFTNARKRIIRNGKKNTTMTV